MKDVFNRVLDFWTSGDVSLVQPLGHDATVARFREAGLSPAEDLLKFYSIVGGMQDYAMDGDLWSCWSIDKIISQVAQYARPGIPFGDWLTHSHVHVARAESAVLSSIWVDGFSGGEPKKVADSLEDFLDRYLRKDETTCIFFEDPTIRNRSAGQARDGSGGPRP